jgi:hypothetical protein
MIKLMFITNDPRKANYAVDSGVNRIFVDLEIEGKLERQGHLDTVISGHTIDDVKIIRKAVPQTELLVRTNPLSKSTRDEVERVLDAGADLLMLPMFRYAEELEEYCEIVRGRAKVIPLVETVTAFMRFHQIVNIPVIEEFYIGLNDLHLGMGTDFMFEILSSGYIDQISLMVSKAGKSFGFGGIAKIGEGILPAELILGEHIRLNSNCVILSRTFHGKSSSLEELKTTIDLQWEINKIREHETNMRKRNEDETIRNQLNVKRIVSDIVRKKYMDKKSIQNELGGPI